MAVARMRRARTTATTTLTSDSTAEPAASDSLTFTPALAFASSVQSEPLPIFRGHRATQHRLYSRSTIVGTGRVEGRRSGRVRSRPAPATEWGPARSQRRGIAPHGGRCLLPGHSVAFSTPPVPLSGKSRQSLLRKPITT